MKTIHLVCNAHLDPIWLWEKEEGMAEAISTFRTAADFCEEYGGFVFNHNEAVLYEWVEEHDPALFARIQKLVGEGKWHIMGGWYLQPDCNMPSGESIFRQIETGRDFFREKFGQTPTTAINFDPFGHSQGLVQILRKNGYDSYLFCRPSQCDCPLPAETFRWKGFDGSEVMAHRAFESYLSGRGQAARKITAYAEKGFPGSDGLVLWGIGNHGGGPSREDMKQISALSLEGYVWKHSSPEAFFAAVRPEELPEVDKSLNPWAVGCYTSQVRIKQTHRMLENQLYLTEKIASHAAVCAGVEYPEAALTEAEKDLVFCEFHDILPGSSIQFAEEAALRQMHHGLEILSRIRTRAFFALCAGQPKAKEGEIPFLVYNPHPYPVETILECEFQLADQNWNEGEFTDVKVYAGEEQLPTQVEKERCNLNLDWRKHVTFRAVLAPSAISRFDCRLEVKSGKPLPEQELSVVTPELSARVSRRTGLLESYCVNGVEQLAADAFLPVVYETDEDPWGSMIRRFDKKLGAFCLMDGPRVVEDGAVRKVIESEFRYEDSRVLLQFSIPKKGTEIGVHVVANWQQPSRVLKLEVPAAVQDGRYTGETMFGTAALPQNGDEAVSQRWCSFGNGKNGITIVNSGTYGSSCKDGVVSLTLLQSACYSALTLGDRPLVPKGRYLPRIDIGLREFDFWLNPVGEESLLSDIHNQPPYALSFFPSGNGELPRSFYQLNHPAIQLAAFYRHHGEYRVRLFNSIGEPVSATFAVLGKEWPVSFGKYEVKTFCWEPDTQSFTEVQVDA